MSKKSHNHDKLRSLLRKVPEAVKKIAEEEENNQSKEEKFDVESFLKSCWNLPPAPHFQNLYRSRAEASLEAGHEKEAARLFLLVQALTVKHQFLIQKTKRINGTMMEIQRGTLKSDKSVLESLEEYESQRTLMGFKEECSVDEVIKRLPEEWTVLQICAYRSLRFSRFKQSKRDIAAEDGNPSLCLVRLRNNGSEPILRRVHGGEGAIPFHKELQSILKEQSLILKEPCSDRKTYWNLREELNARMQALVKSMESSWLGSSKSFLLGKLKSKKACENLCEVANEVCDILEIKCNQKNSAKLETLLSAATFLSPEQTFADLILMFPDVDEEQVYSASSLVRKYAQTKLRFQSEPRHPVILILDPEVQSLPWESLPCVTSSKQSMSRVASLEFLSCLWQTHCSSPSSVVSCGLSSDSVFYLIDPDSTLPKTQERLEKVMKRFQDWEGLTGKPPEPGQLANVLGNKDAFIYSGHGSGNKYISEDQVEKLKIRGAPLLLGCSSGELSRHGRQLDPLGVVQSYMIGMAPAVVGFLWPITDMDVDKWTIEFLEYWLMGRESDILQAVADKRKVFSHFVNAAALVVYGLPVAVQQK